MIKKLLYTTLCLLALHGCKIENDIPYPIEEASISAFEVEGQCNAPEGAPQAGINTDTRTVTLYVDDTVDLTELRIMRFSVSPEDAVIVADEDACVDIERFPTSGFEVPDNLADTRIDCSAPVQLTLQTYQDYVWTVTVNQEIERAIEVEHQAGQAPVFDFQPFAAVDFRVSLVGVKRPHVAFGDEIKHPENTLALGKINVGVKSFREAVVRQTRHAEGDRARTPAHHAFREHVRPVGEIKNQVFHGVLSVEFQFAPHDTYITMQSTIYPVQYQE